MVFNSLGSNYNLGFAFKALTAGNNQKDKAELLQLLESKYSGRAVLLYKAREAITLALRLLNLPKGSAVAINGYTCYAVYKAIIDAGLTVEYLDIPEKGLNFTGDELNRALTKNSEIKVVMVQNTLGFVCGLEKIAEICKQNNLVLIEDLAHSVGAFYENGKEAGTVGDFTVLSFSQDKTIDGVSGGALIIRNEKYKNANLPPKESVSDKQQSIDGWYPMLTLIIRTTYGVGLGKAFHAFLKKINWLSLGLGSVDHIVLHELPVWYSGLILERFKNLEQELGHRREVAKIYFENLDSAVLLKTGSVESSSALRFPISVYNRKGLIEHLRRQNIHVSDIWYDAPVAPAKFLHLSDYHSQCPNSNRLSNDMLNLPTHINVSESIAKTITREINQWLKLQSSK